MLCRSLPVTTTSVHGMPRSDVVSATFNGKPIDMSTLTNMGAYMPPQPVIPIATSGRGTMATASTGSKGFNSMPASNGMQFEDM